jgi:hypothetical protein
MPTTHTPEIEAVAMAALRAVREMDAACPTGLCKYPARWLEGQGGAMAVRFAASLRTWASVTPGG